MPLCATTKVLLTVCTSSHERGEEEGESERAVAKAILVSIWFKRTRASKLVRIIWRRLTRWNFTDDKSGEVVGKFVMHKIESTLLTVSLSARTSCLFVVL